MRRRIIIESVVMEEAAVEEICNVCFAVAIPSK